MSLDKGSRQTRLLLSAARIFGASATGLNDAVFPGVAMAVTLSGDQEVPPVMSLGTGSGKIRVGADNLISGSIVTTNVNGTAAHIHEGTARNNGAVLFPLVKAGDTYSGPAGTKLSDMQFEILRAGNLYINVRSAANPGGEIRAQLRP